MEYYYTLIGDGKTFVSGRYDSKRKCTLDFCIASGDATEYAWGQVIEVNSNNNPSRQEIVIYTDSCPNYKEL